MQSFILMQNLYKIFFLCTNCILTSPLNWRFPPGACELPLGGARDKKCNSKYVGNMWLKSFGNYCCKPILTPSLFLPLLRRRSQFDSFDFHCCYVIFQTSQLLVKEQIKTHHHALLVTTCFLNIFSFFFLFFF